MFWWVIIIVAGFLIVRSIVRAGVASRHSGGAAPPAYGYGGFGGGGSFWSGLLGGLGGAWLGNEFFRSEGGAPAEAGQIANDSRVSHSDAGQANNSGGGGEV
ncbi:MAG: hypothetical protein WA304_03240, partial [Candidatus Cybelea sp.]